MCAVCDFENKLVPATKHYAAIGVTGARTVWGYYHSDDAAILSRHYPHVGQELIQKIAECINHPRLLEVAGIVEMAERFLEKSFSQIRGLTINIAANPLSVLFWSEKKGKVRRIKTMETELLHGPMEKMSLRRRSIDLINRLLAKRGVNITFGCSCCAIAVTPDDVEALYSSNYYKLREEFGRQFDSDVLCVSESLHEILSVCDIPEEILKCTADFGKAEVRSYMRLARAADAVQENVVTTDFSKSLPHVKAFLTGK